MGLGYQRTDFFAFDYDLWFVDEGRIALRGPPIEITNHPPVACAGAAQTFGRFVNRPYPYQLMQLTGLQTLNLGISGAGPETFLRRPTLLKCMQSAHVNIMQVMSGRSVSAHLLECQQNAGVVKFTDGPRQGETMLAERAYRLLKEEYGVTAFREQIEAVRAEWINNFIELLESIGEITYLLWISDRPPEEMPLSPENLGPFPHLITHSMLKTLSMYCAGIIYGTLREKVCTPILDLKSREMLDVFDRDNFPHRPDPTRCFNLYYAPQKQHDYITARIFDRLNRDALLNDMFRSTITDFS